MKKKVGLENAFRMLHVALLGGLFILSKRKTEDCGLWGGEIVAQNGTGGIPGLICEHGLTTTCCLLTLWVRVHTL